MSTGRPQRCWLVAAALVAGVISEPVPSEAQAIAREPAPGEGLPVVRHSLDNGMTFLILERHQSPTVAFVVHYPVGSVNEHLGNTGIAHVLEHMLFKGSEEIGTSDAAAEGRVLQHIDVVRDSLLMERAANPPDSGRIQRFQDAIRELEEEARAFVVPNEFDRLLTEAGARGLNATTSHEATRYFVELPSNRTELWFALEAERMQRPVFREFYTELDVVGEERRMRLETNPGAILETELLATAFRVHPYGVPVIGHASDLESLTRRQALEYFLTYYGAQNAVVAIVGDVDTDQIVEWAEGYFGPVRRGQPPPPVLAREPPQRGERRVRVEYDAEPRLAIGWRAVAGSHDDAPALSMLAAVLTGGRTTPLYRRLVTEDQSAVQVNAYLSPAFSHDRLFTVMAVPKAPHGVAELETAIYEEIERIKDTPPDSLALTRIKNQLRAGDYRRLSSNFGLASQIADSEATLGSWQATFRLSGRLMDVSPTDVQRVARTYLIDRTRSVATLGRGGGR